MWCLRPMKFLRGISSRNERAKPIGLVVNELFENVRATESFEEGIRLMPTNHSNLSAIATERSQPSRRLMVKYF